MKGVVVSAVICAAAALSGSASAAPLPAFVTSRRAAAAAPGVAPGAGARAFAHLGRALSKAGGVLKQGHAATRRAAGDAAVASALARAGQHARGKAARTAARFAARQGEDPDVPDECIADLTAANACAGLTDGRFEALINAGGFADATAKAKFCTADKCDVKLRTFIKCWKTHGKESDNTKPAKDINALLAIDFCAATGLEFAIQVPSTCLATVGTCDKGIIADLLNAGDLPIVRGDLDQFCKASCFNNAPRLFECLVTEGIMDAADKPSQSDLDTTKNFMCARGADSQLCYNGLRAMVKAKCHEDFPDDIERPAVLAAWMKDKQDGFCKRKCGVITNRALICLAEARATFPGESSPVTIDKADAAFTDLLCLREGSGESGKFCLADLAALETTSEKSADQLTEADLTSVCSTCTKRIIQRLAVAEVDGVKDAVAVFGVMCIQDEGKFCLPQLPKAYRDEVFAEHDPSKDNSGSSSSSSSNGDDDKAPAQEVLDAICGTRCARRITYRLIELDEALDNDTGASEAAKMKARAKARAEVEFFCFKNAKGSYCARLEETSFAAMTCPALKAVGEASLPFQTGADININANAGAGVCSDTCKADVTKIGSELGCCLGLFVDQLETEIISEEGFDDSENSAERVALRAFLTAFRKGIKICGADTESGDNVSCAKPTGTKIAEVRIKTSIKVATVNKAKGEISGAMRKDICTPCLSNGDLMKHCKVKEVKGIPDPNKIGADGKVETTATAGASTRQSAAAGENAEFVISFQGKDDAATAKFEATYKTAVANNDLAPLATSAAVQKETGSSLQTANFDQSQREAEADQSPTPTPAANSTAAAVVASTGAVALTVLAALA
jgi:hypothetical protein